MASAPPNTPPAEPTFWDTVKERSVALGKWAVRILVSPGAALILVVAAILLAAMGVKGIQIGGLLGKLFGKKAPEKKIVDVANSVIEERVDDQGKVIPPGQPDSKGITQAVVVPINNPGIFSNPDTVIFTPPDATKPVEVQLPDGVKAKDVEKVIVVKPEVYAVTVKSTSKVPAKKIDDLLKKYGNK